MTHNGAETGNLILNFKALKPKTLKTLYWTINIIFSLLMLADGIAGFFYTQQGAEAMSTLGYPMYLSKIVGTAKILGAIALLQPKWKTIKEWAYSGFTVCFIGASASWAFSGGPFFAVAMPWIALAILFLDYFLWKKSVKLS